MTYSMQPTTPPQTPQKADNRPTDNDVQQELRKLNDSLDQMKRQLDRLEANAVQPSGPRLYRSADASNADCLTRFWSRQAFSVENFKNMKLVFRDVMIHGPGREISGVRKQPVSDLGRRADNPPTLLCFGGPDHLGEIMMKPTSLPVMDNDSVIEEWDLWQKVEECFLKQWPDAVVPSFLYQTGHFDHNLQFLEHTYVMYQELSHARGMPELIFWKSHGERGLAKHMDTNIEEAQITGRSWLLCSREPVVTISLCALVFNQLACGDDLQFPMMARCLIGLLRRYTGPFPISHWTRWCYENGDEGHLQFHARYPKLSCAPVAQESGIAGYYVYRDSRTVTDLRNCNKKYLIEERVAITVTTTLRLTSPFYTAVSLIDSPKLARESGVGHELLWENQNIRLCGKLTGVAVFQSMIHELIKRWAAAWTSILNDFSLEVRPPFRTICHGCC
ncbi:hypothetical protein LY76DRAFT_29068 [Colletotrichum caudatum]|nr:hypothetical protein LY76DRAFT_29068 [Colletotrichum caudatum]